MIFFSSGNALELCPSRSSKTNLDKTETHRRLLEQRDEPLRSRQIFDQQKNALGVHRLSLWSEEQLWAVSLHAKQQITFELFVKHNWKLPVQRHRCSPHRSGKPKSQRFQAEQRHFWARPDPQERDWKESWAEAAASSIQSLRRRVPICSRRSHCGCLWRNFRHR